MTFIHHIYSNKLKLFGPLCYIGAHGVFNDHSVIIQVVFTYYTYDIHDL